MKLIAIATITAAVLLTGCTKEEIKNNVTLPRNCTTHEGKFFFNEDRHIDNAVGESTVSCENAKHNWYHTDGPPIDYSYIPGQTGTPDPSTKLLP